MNSEPRPGKGTIEGDTMKQGEHEINVHGQDNGKAIDAIKRQSDALQREKVLSGGVVVNTNDDNTRSDNGNLTSTGLLDGQSLLFDLRNTEGDKFVNSIIFSDNKKFEATLECKSYDQWRAQSKMNFRFIPLTDPILPSSEIASDIRFLDPIKLHEEVKKYNLLNYLGARIHVNSQMNIQAWKALLRGYWDQQLLQCLEFGFPLGSNRMCPLKHDKANHKSALEFPQDVEKYIQEEKSFGAILGPFKEAPIQNLHYSPFMTRHKPNSDTFWT